MEQTRVIQPPGDILGQTGLGTALRSVRESGAASWASLGKHGRKEAVGEMPLHQVGGTHCSGQCGPGILAKKGHTLGRRRTCVCGSLRGDPKSLRGAFSLDPRDTGPVTQRTSISTLQGAAARGRGAGVIEA